MSRWHIGIDAGGTHCRSLIADSSGKIMGYGKGGPANTRLGADQVLKSLLECLNNTLENSGLDQSIFSHAYLCIGIAGFSRSLIVESLIQSSVFQTFQKVVFSSDAYIAHLGAHRENDGGTVIVGTGSIGIATIKGNIRQFGGLGFPHSDLGGGAHIGLLALQHALASHRDMIADDTLDASILSVTNVDTRNITDFLASLEPTDYANLAPIVAHHAKIKEPTAVEILNKSAGHIDDICRLLVKSGIDQICLVGGLSTTLEPLIDKQHRKKLAKPQGNALQGALLIVRHHAGHNETNTLPDLENQTIQR